MSTPRKIAAIVVIGLLQASSPALASKWRCDDGQIINSGETCRDGGMASMIVDEVQTRQTPEVNPRSAPEGQSRSVREVGDYAPSRSNDLNCNFDAVAPEPPKSALLDKVTVSGLGCKGIRCEISKGFMPAEVKIRIYDDKFTQDYDQTIGLTVVNAKTRQLTERRTYTNWIDLSLYPVGTYVFQVSPVCSSKVLAAGRFSVTRYDPNAKKRAAAGRNNHFNPNTYCFPNCGYVNPTIYQW